MTLMKKIIIALIILIASLSYACENNLDLTPISSITTSSFWKTEDDAEGALYGMYSQFRTTLNSNENVLYWMDFRSGFWTIGTSGGAGDNEKLWQNNLDATTTSTNWSPLYTLINDCNLILKYTPGITFSNQTFKDEVLGHAYFVRAYAYFKLAQLWGDVPIVTDGFESINQELYNPRSPVTEVYALVKEDIAQAVAKLPARSPGVKPWMASKEAANMLKTEICLWLAKRAGGGNAELTEARTSIDAVLLNSYILENNYADAFRNDKSKEIIFSIYFDYTEEPNPSGRDIGQYGWNFVNNINYVPAALRNIVPHSGSTQWLTLSPDYTLRFLKPVSEDQRTAVNWQEIPNPSGGTVKWINKYLGTLIDGTRRFYDDIRIYRQAEAYLFKAEVENALDNKDVAIANLNLVSKRAYGIVDYYPLSLTKAEVDAAILEERLIEFAAEGKSWLDIIRFGKAFEIITSLVGREGDNQGNILLFPVNQDVISRNTKIIQTPGY